MFYYINIVTDQTSNLSWNFRYVGHHPPHTHHLHPQLLPPYTHPPPSPSTPPTLHTNYVYSRLYQLPFYVNFPDIFACLFRNRKHIATICSLSSASLIVCSTDRTVMYDIMHLVSNRVLSIGTLVSMSVYRLLVCPLNLVIWITWTLSKIW